MPVTTIILAGGKSQRFGSNKALFEISGHKIIEYILRLVKPFSSEILISTNSNAFDFLTLPIIRDEYTEAGPAAGIHAGLKASAHEINLILSCDTPLLNNAFLKYLIQIAGHYDITVPVHNNQIQPLIGVFKKQTYPQFAHELSVNKKAPIDIIKTLDTQYVKILPEMPFYHSEMFRSLNTKEDIHIIKTLISK